MRSGQHPVFTVFTATHNRESLLCRAYRSLEAQTFRSFEWVIIDDGSTDNTRAVVEQWRSTASFDIRYAWQPRGGKHVAFNHAVREARGSLFVILDSDDRLLPHALERMNAIWSSLPKGQRQRYGGVVGLCIDEKGAIVGDAFPEPIIDCDALEMRIRYRPRGDKAFSFRTDVLRRFPFPEDLGSFVTESLVWNRMAQHYLCRFVNEPMSVIQYQPGGLTDREIEVRVRAPAAASTYYRELAAAGRRLPFKIALRVYGNYVRYSLHQNASLREIVATAPSRAAVLLALPVGWLLHVRDRLHLRSR